jgi:hypothetical protein
MSDSNVFLPAAHGWDPRGLDRLLHAFPAGELSEIAGPWSAGAGSLLLALIARVTASGQHVALVDGADAFDPTTAMTAGVDLERLLWLRCRGRSREAWSASDLVVRCAGFALVALDLGEPRLIRRERMPYALCRRLKLAAEQSGAILVLRVPQPIAGTAAALAVSLRRLESRWIGQPRATRLAGITAEARIVRCHAQASSLAAGQVIQWAL